MKKTPTTRNLSIFCPFCGANYTAEMEENLEALEEFNSFGSSYHPTGNIDIYCSNCKKLVYRKEVNK